MSDDEKDVPKGGVQSFEVPEAFLSGPFLISANKVWFCGTCFCNFQTQLQLKAHLNKCPVSQEDSEADEDSEDWEDFICPTGGSD